MSNLQRHLKDDLSALVYRAQVSVSFTDSYSINERQVSWCSEECVRRALYEPQTQLSVRLIPRRPNLVTRSSSTLERHLRMSCASQLTSTGIAGANAPRKRNPEPGQCRHRRIAILLCERDAKTVSRRSVARATHMPAVTSSRISQICSAPRQ